MVNKQYGELDYHEVVDRCSSVLTMIDKLLLAHPLVINTPWMKKKLEKITYDLACVYQKVSAEAMTKFEDDLK